MIATHMPRFSVPLFATIPSFTSKKLTNDYRFSFTLSGD
jgi:hypothetical protein